MPALCWPFHTSAIPETSERIVDARGRLWDRAGVRLWAYAPGDQVEEIKHESWLLREHGPVRCPVELEHGLPLTNRR